MIYERVDYFHEKSSYFRLYNEMIHNYMLSEDEFVEKIKNNVNKDFDSSSNIMKFLLKTKATYSVAKSNVMINIMEYFQGKKTQEEAKAEIDKVEKKNSAAIARKDIKDHEGNMQKILSNVNTVISDERPYKKLIEDKVVTDDLLFSKVNFHIKEITDDMYIDFIIKYKGLEKISCEELSQYKQLLEMFVTNLTRKVNKLTILEDDKEIINFYVRGQENLTEYFTTKPTRLKKWKLKKLSILLSYYSEMLKIIEEIINTKSVEGIKKIKLDKEIMSNEEDFILDYHTALQNISNTFAYIKKINNVTDERNKMLCKKYNEKILMENNK